MAAEAPTCEIAADDDLVFVTHELESRPERQRDHKRERQALNALAELLADDPAAAIERLVELAMELTGGSSAGVSLHEPAGTVRLRQFRGALQHLDGTTRLTSDSPCGVALDRNETQLARNPDRLYRWLADDGPHLAELLLVPLRAGSDEPVGILWVTADTPSHFSAGDAALMGDLARLAALAHRLDRSEERFREQDLLTHEMAHRVKNVFAVAESIVRLTAGRAQSAEELAESLGRRLSALSSAHALAGGSSLGERAEIELPELIEAIVEPFGSDRFSLSGPQAQCSPRAASALALVIHELASNAAKHGALSKPGGKVAVRWTADREALELQWVETGGPRVQAAPEPTGFGSTLIRRTIARQFGGEIDEDWREEGLRCTMRVARSKLGG